MCGVIGIWGKNEKTEAAVLAYLGGYAQLHRGQESAGIVSSDGREIFGAWGMGKVSDVFTEEKLAHLRGYRAVGHNRYATTGSSALCNAQPLLGNSRYGPLAIAHNGNLVNTKNLRDELVHAGALFRSTTDTEIIAQLIARSSAGDFLTAVVDSLKRVEGAYSLVIMNTHEMIVMRDPRGFRPLCMGELPDGGLIFASETCALDLIEARYMRDVRPGEVLLARDGYIQSFFPFETQTERFCFFELVYFSRPDSVTFNYDVYQFRKALGCQLAHEAPVVADVVVPVPDSGVPAAMGYAQESGIPFELGLTRNHYVGRTFIEPKQSIRHFGVKVKHNPVRSVFQGQRIVIVDDSIVRGTTSKKLVEMARRAGAREVHVRISSPPPREPCLYGIDTPTHKEYIANQFDVGGIRTFINADSIVYLSQGGMLAVAERTNPQSFCTTCWTGKHPMHIFGEER